MTLYLGENYGRSNLCTHTELFVHRNYKFFNELCSTLTNMNLQPKYNIVMHMLSVPNPIALLSIFELFNTAIKYIPVILFRFLELVRTDIVSKSQKNCGILICKECLNYSSYVCLDLTNCYCSFIIDKSRSPNF